MNPEAFSDLAAARHSVRDFRPDPVPGAVLDAIRKDLSSPAWSRHSSEEEEAHVSDEAESSSDDELPAQEAPARALPAGAKPLDGGSVEDELDELLEEY